MKLSTKARYGLRALVDLAVYSTGEQTPLINIAKRQELSVNYLEQVFSLLKKSGIVNSIKGAQGGYMLARPADEITVGAVIRAIEGEIIIVEQDKKETDSLPNQNMHECLNKLVWDPLNESVSQVIDGITLIELVKDYQSMDKDGSLMYYI